MNRYLLWTLAFLILVPTVALAQTLPRLTVGLDEVASPQHASAALQVVFLITILSIAPGILVMMTPFTRYIIVLGFLRRALGTQTTPPNQIIAGFALFLTWFTLQPEIRTINESALQPYLAQEMTWREALPAAMRPMREHMMRQTGERELATMMRIAQAPRPATVEDIPNAVLIPSYVLSELRTGFIIGFLLYLPFLMIDMVVASLLMSLGMMMLPPVMVSLPLKLILFVAVDGWNLVVHGLVTSVR